MKSYSLKGRDKVSPLELKEFLEFLNPWARKFFSCHSSNTFILYTVQMEVIEEVPYLMSPGNSDVVKR